MPTFCFANNNFQAFTSSTSKLLSQQHLMSNSFKVTLELHIKLSSGKKKLDKSRQNVSRQNKNDFYYALTFHR